MPYLAHAPMEPLNCLVSLGPDRCEIWTGTQFQTVDQANAARAAGLKPEQVADPHPLPRRRLRPPRRARVRFHRGGGARGKGRRRAGQDDLDARGRHPRAATTGRCGTPRISAGLDADGQAGGVEAHHRRPVDRREHTVRRGDDQERRRRDVGGRCRRTRSTRSPTPPSTCTARGQPVPVLWWRSVGHTHTGFVVESFIDELAHAAGTGPVRLPARAARRPAAPPRRAGAGRPEGGLGHAAARRAARGASRCTPRSAASCAQVARGLDRGTTPSRCTGSSARWTAAGPSTPRRSAPRWRAASSSGCPRRSTARSP